MKTLIFLLSLMLILTFIYQAEAEDIDQNLCPYFFVKGDPEVDSFPLLKTEANVNIAGIIANVELTQVYKNDGKKTLEAVYIFPMGTKSAIHAMRMKIGDRIIQAEIKEKEEAKQIYEKAKEEGKTASLLEQQRPNVFQMNVANIMPGDVIEVIVSYTEILVPEEGVYQFVFPTVVGPRYTGESGGQGDNGGGGVPVLHEGEEPPYEFGIKVNLKTGLPLSDIRVTSHNVDIKKHDLDKAEVVLLDEKGGNKDFILKYSLRGGAIQTGILLFPGDEEKFFLSMIEPPERVTIDMVPPREYVFILDVSGSMGGFPISVSKALIEKIITGLRKEDYFNIMFFAGGANTLFPTSQPATNENIQKALNMLRAQQGGGGTNMLNALNLAFSLEKMEGLSRIMVIATDGYVDVEKRVFDLIYEKLGEANFFAFGIGTSVNRYLIEGIARAGRGEPFVVANAAEANETAERFMEYIEHPLLTDIKVDFAGFDAYDVEPPGVPDLFAQRPLILFGKYRNASGRIKITGNTASGDYGKEFALASVEEDENNVALKYLWAREKIARLSDYGRAGANVKNEILALGLKYNLMTEYTSFVAVDYEVRETGEVVKVDQPLPLPVGVSDTAVPGGTQGYGGMLTEVEPQEKEPATWGKIKITVLYQNYPNPFNPETWIPFQLAESAEVFILIHDIHGNLVRKIKLGNLPAGLYLSKGKAAYWDGCDDKGEKVSSGVYFYTIQAVDFTDTRKMVVTK